MKNNVYIVGLGMISGIGMNVAETLSSLKKCKHGISHIDFVSTALKGQIPVAEVKQNNHQLKQILNIPQTETINRTALLGMIAAKEAIENSQINISKYRNGIVSATSVGGMDLSEHFYNEFHHDNYSGKLDEIKGHDCADSTMHIAKFLDIRDYQATISTACSSSANSIMFATRLIKNNILDVVIAGGTDSLTRFTLNGFNTLMILDRSHCKPFDAHRAGLNLGEGAGYIVLVSEKIINETDVEPLAIISGYGNANDAFHQTASSPDGHGAWLAMNYALKMSRLQPDDISYINVHGTGTSNNDLSEGMAMKRIFGDKLPPFSSTKAFTGHTLGAAGGIEAVISLLAIQYGIIYPNLNFSEPIPEINIYPNTQLIENAQIDHVLSNSFGFGGNNTTLIFSKPNI